QPRMPSLLEIPIRPAEAIDQKVPKPRLCTRQVLRRIHRPEHIVLRNPAVEGRDHSREALLSAVREDLDFLHQAGGTKSASIPTRFTNPGQPAADRGLTFSEVAMCSPSRPSCPSCPSRLSCLVICLACLIAPLAYAQVGGVVGGVVVGRPGGQPPGDPRPVMGRSAIRGRVMSDAGQPMRRAMVRVSAQETRVTRTTSTDAEGRYEIRDLPAGRYTVSVSKPAFVAWSYGQTRPSGAPKTVVLAESQTADNIDIRMFRGAVIAGRIPDEVGEPVPNAMVSPIRKQYSQGHRRLLPEGMRAQTNDIGEYRIFGLSPGHYYVSATAQAQTIGTPTANGIDLAGERNG